MPFFFVGLVVAPWVASATGRLIRSTLGHNHPTAPEANPTKPMPHESPLKVPQPAQTDLKDRSFSDLKMKHQNIGTGLNCLFDETKEKKQEQDRTSLCSGSVTNTSHSGSNKLPPLALYMSVTLNPFFSCPLDEEDDLLLAEGWLDKNTQMAAVFSVSYAEILECIKRFKEQQQKVHFMATVFFRVARAKIVDFWSWIVEKTASVLTKAQATFSSWISCHCNAFGFIWLFVAVSFLLYFFIYRKRVRIMVVFSNTEDILPQVLPPFHLQAKYFPGNEQELQITFPEPQQKLLLLYPGPEEGLHLVFKQPEEQITLFVQKQQGLKLFFPHSEEEWQVPFQGPVDELLLLHPKLEQGFLLLFPSQRGRICATISNTTARIRAGFSSIQARTSDLFPKTRADIQEIILRAYDLEPEQAMLSVLSLWLYIVCCISIRHTTLAFHRIQRRIKRAVSRTRTRIADSLVSAYEKTRAFFGTVSRGIAALF